MATQPRTNRFQGIWWLILSMLVLVTLGAFPLTLTFMYTQMTSLRASFLIAYALVYLAYLGVTGIGLVRIGRSFWWTLTGLTNGLFPFMLYCILPIRRD